MPGPLAQSFTCGEQAALAVIASEVMEHGTCSLPLDAIAARSGTSRSTVKRAIKQARALGLIHVTERPRPGAKHLPSVIRIVSAAWLAWLKHRMRRIGVQNRTATNTEGFTKGLRSNVEAAPTKTARQRHDGRAHRENRATPLRA
jgi:DNA-binding transcriptional MocR family regulator